MRRAFLFYTALSLVAFLSGCQDFRESVYEKPVGERVADKLNVYSNLLTDTNSAWIMTYYDSKEQKFGGFHFAMKFSKDGTVTMSSDIDIPNFNQLKVSYYSLKQEQTTELTFSSYTHLHQLSDPDYYQRGVGLGLDFAFIILSASRDTIVLQERNRSNKLNIYLTRMPSTHSLQDYATKFPYSTTENLKKLLTLHFTFGIPIDIEDNLHNKIATFSAYNSAYRRFTLDSLNNEKMDSSRGIIPTEKGGFRFFPPAQENAFLGGDFEWDPINNYFKNEKGYTMKPNTAILTDQWFADHLANVTADVEDRNYTRFAYFNNSPDVDDVVRKSSLSFNNMFTDAQLVGVRMTVRPYQSYSADIPDTLIAASKNHIEFIIRENGSNYSGYYYYNRIDTVAGGRIVFIPHSGNPFYKNTTTNSLFQAKTNAAGMDRLRDLFFDTGGWYVIPDGKLERYTNLIAKFISYKDPTIYFVAYMF